jgi:predicted nucleic acid-binding protein
MTAVFLDSNVLIYAYSDDKRAEQSRDLLDREYTLGVQTLNEFAYVARRKLGMSWEAIEEASFNLSESAELVVPTWRQDHTLSLNLARRYQLALFDALMLAIALRAQCTIFYSEDMHHGLVIEDRMTILNPFA